jgi:hypothetical protein
VHPLHVTPKIMKVQRCVFAPIRDGIRLDEIAENVNDEL